MARQTIPRFDLYAELGVEPSADDGAIESAYHTQIDRHLPNLDAAATRSRVVRLNTARDWLSDSELRSRYDASRARSSARSTAAAPASRRSPSSKPRTRKAAAALTAAEAAEAEARAAAEAEAAAGATTTHRELSRSDFSWPAADLDRPATPTAPRTRSSRRMLRGIAGLAALIVVLALVVLAISLLPPSNPVAVASPTAPPPTPTAIPATPSPSPEPTVAATPLPTEFVVPPAALRQAAWDAIQALAAAAAAGDVATAQTYLGDTATGLQGSGLKRATFPDVGPGDIGTQREGDLYVALAENDRLTSPDGNTWTFDYADRPLRAYAFPEGIRARDLYWIETDGRHHIYLRVASATVSKSGVSVEFKWRYTLGVLDEPTYFRRASLLISSVSLDGTPITVTAASLSMRGVTTLTSTVIFTGVGTVPDNLEIGVTVSNPRTAGGAARAIETVFKLEGR